MTKHYLILALLMATAIQSSAQEDNSTRDTLTTQIFFRKAEANYDGSYRGNDLNLDLFISRIKGMHADTLIDIKKIIVAAGASPEGPSVLNEKLSQKRAHALRLEIEQRLPYLKSALTENAIGEDWDGLAALIANNPNFDGAQQALAIIRDTPVWVRDASGRITDSRKRRLQKLNGGTTWRYLYANFFEQLRGSSANLSCEISRRPMRLPSSLPASVYVKNANFSYQPLAQPITVVPKKESRPWYVGIRTNMLYDALLIPNIGVDIYLGKKWSVDAIWHYAWWKCDHRHNYWRTYGGDIALRRWFGSKANQKPLTGHHLGIYAQIVTYDFELGARGYLGPRWSYGGGFEYGYTLPLRRRLNIDFSLGLGYLGGKYYEYVPIDQCYVWQATKQRHWFGPTKLEISLVWLIGHGNVNVNK